MKDRCGDRGGLGGRSGEGGSGLVGCGLGSIDGFGHGDVCGVEKGCLMCALRGRSRGRRELQRLFEGLLGGDSIGRLVFGFGVCYFAGCFLSAFLFFVLITRSPDPPCRPAVIQRILQKGCWCYCRPSANVPGQLCPAVSPQRSNNKLGIFPDAISIFVGLGERKCGIDLVYI